LHVVARRRDREFAERKTCSDTVAALRSAAIIEEMKLRRRRGLPLLPPAYSLITLSALCVTGVHPSAARASSFAGRLSLGPTYMQNDTRRDLDDSAGPGLSAQLDAGLQLSAPLVLHATLIYDYSRWLEVGDLTGRYEGSMLGLGLGATARSAGLSLGGAVGAQLTRFPQSDDPPSGPNGASVGPFLSLSAGYVWTIEGPTNAGIHAVFRCRESKDETNSIVYDPIGYQLGLVLSLGLDGEPLLEH
jgi:hypothetical protein